MKYVVGNYKMQLTGRESAALARGVLHGIRGGEVLPEVILCPSYTALTEVRKVIARSHVALGAQNVAATPAGPHTGEVSAAQLVDSGCTHALIGHSERRHGLGEDDAAVNGKVVQALAAGLTPIICVGETHEERSAGQAEAVVARQVAAALAHVQLPKRTKCVFAYEPVWAIGTGSAATPADAVAMHRVIRHAVLGTDVAAEDCVVLYGGSVDSASAYTFLREREIDGVLVGGASLKIHEFLAIVAAGVDVMQAQG